MLRTNIDPSYAEQVFAFANSRGDVMVREIFGAGIALNEWVEPIMEYFLNPHITLKPNNIRTVLTSPWSSELPTSLSTM